MRFQTSPRALLAAAIALTTLTPGCSSGPTGTDAGRDLAATEIIVFDTRDAAPEAHPDVAAPVADVATADPGHETPGADLAEAVADTATEAQADVAPDPGPPDPGGPVDPKACVTDADCAAQGACPSDATRGCTCVTDKNGGKRCKPACTVDADCPTPPDKVLVCSSDGVCVPQGSGPAEPPPEIVEVVDAVPDAPLDGGPDAPPPPDGGPDAPPPPDGGPDAPPPPDVVADAPVTPTSCTTSDDCAVAGACPPNATLGCTCVTDKNGDKRCKPACTVDADCPTPPDKVLVCSPDGVCVPQG